MLTNHSVYRAPPEHGRERLINVEFGELLDVFLDTETGAFYAVNSDRDEYSEVNLEDPMGIESNWRDISDDGSVVLLLSPPDIGLWSPSANETK